MEKEKSRGSRLLYLVPLLGTFFYIAYILAATQDVVYTDYIRLINSYLPDVWNPAKFFVPDILTRMPVNYLERIINVVFFHYSTTFDMILGAVSMGAAGLVLALYCRDRKTGPACFLAAMVFFFSLNKWEMITNGTGWCHFLAFAGFYWHYLLWDRVWGRQINGIKGEKENAQDRRERRLLMVLPWLITLGTAGPYCGAYTAVLVLIYGGCFLLDWKEKKRPDFRHLIYGACGVIPMILYLISNSFAVTEHAGATGRSIAQVLGDNFMLFPKFLIKSLASMVMGEEVLMDFLARLDKGMALCYLLGLAVLFAYILAIYWQIRLKLYRQSIFPLMLIFWGGLNHLLVLAARWIFENSDYGMSSRYALQYQVGILGIILTFGLARKAAGRWFTQAAKVISLLLVCIILGGNLYTTGKELDKASDRKAYAANIEQVALNYRQESDEELETWLQYHHGPEKIRHALEILEEQKWNIFGGE